MKKVKLVYNPFSGDRRFKEDLDSIAEIFFDAGYITNIIRISTPDAIEPVVQSITDEDIFVVSGGDGTLNMAVNALKHHKKSTPLGIIPSGTANDFASFLGLPKEPLRAAHAIAHGKIISADLGLVNGHYFINVCGGGLFINISHSMGNDISKSIFGKLAYYIKGLGQLPNITPLKMRITTGSAVYEEDFALFLVLNTGGCGGFNKISPNASISDGFLDFVAFRAMAMTDIAGLFLKILQGEHLDDRRILFSQETAVTIENLGDSNVDTDADGEPGPKMPLNITCEKGALNLVVSTPSK